MPSASTILRARMLSLPAVMAVVDKQQIYPGQIPQRSIPPCISMAIVGGTRDLTMSGQGKQQMKRVSVETTALSVQQAQDIGEILLEQLPCVKQEIAGGHLVDIVFAETDWEDSADNLLTFRRGLHFRVHWQN